MYPAGWTSGSLRRTRMVKQFAEAVMNAEADTVCGAGSASGPSSG
jgi:hypothetical protein